MKWKKYLFFCSAAILIGLLSTGCSEALDGSSSDAPGVSLRLVAGQAPSTRAGTNVQTLVFDAGEQLNAYITAKKTSADDIIVGAPTVCTAKAPEGTINELTPNAVPYFPQDNGYTLDIYALYPVTVFSGSSSFTVCADQKENTDYKSSDLMWASVSDISRTPGATSTTASLAFTRKMSKLIVRTVIDDATNVGTVTNVKLKGVYRRIGFTPSTGALNASELADQGDIVFNSTSGTGTDESACLFPPQSLQRGDFLEVETTQGTAIFALALSAEKAFSAGSQYEVEIHLSRQNLLETATIGSWPDNYNLNVAALGAGTLQIDDIADQNYTGSAITPAVTVTSSGTLLTLDTDYTVEYYNNVNAGYAVVVVTGKAGTAYEGKTAAKTFHICTDKAVITTTPVANNRTYDGTAADLLSTAAAAQLQIAGTAVAVKYSTSQNGYYTTEIPKATKAGNYKVWYKVEPTESYSGVDPDYVEVTIAKATIDVNNVTPPTANVLTYNEQYQKLVTAGSVTGDGQITYCLGTDATNAPTTGYSTDIPSAINAGTYYVWWQAGDDNHNGTNPACITVTMARKPGRATLIYGNTILNSTVGGTTPVNLLFDVGEGKNTKKVITVDRNGNGLISATVTSGSSDVSVSVADNKISVTRLTDNSASATISVNVADGTNYQATATSFDVDLYKNDLKLSDVKSTDQRYLGYIVSSTGYVYAPTEEGIAALRNDGGTEAGMITYVGTTGTTHGFVMALRDANNGATCTFGQASGKASSHTPTISGYNWKLGSKTEYETAVSNKYMFDDGTWWSAFDESHWTSSSGDAYQPNHQLYHYEWCFQLSYFWQNFEDFKFLWFSDWYTNDHVDNCQVRPLFAF